MLNFKKFEERLPDSLSQGVDDSPTRQVIFKHSKADSPTRWVGESFFDYEYIGEFEAKSGTTWKVV